MAKRKKRSRTPRKGRLPVGLLALWTVLLLETLWLAGFMWSTRSVLPEVFRQWPPGAKPPGWNRAKQENLEVHRDEVTQLELEKLLTEKGSRAPKPERKAGTEGSGGSGN